VRDTWTDGHTDILVVISAFNYAAWPEKNTNQLRLGCCSIGVYDSTVNIVAQ